VNVVGREATDKVSSAPLLGASRAVPWVSSRWRYRPSSGWRVVLTVGLGMSGACVNDVCLGCHRRRGICP
jgi:hypothetical protein